MSGSRQIMADWTDERVTKLKKLARGGLSASQISRALGFCSRNAVIGKLSRLGEALGVGRGAKAAAPKPERVKKVFAPAKRRGRPPAARIALFAPEPTEPIVPIEAPGDLRLPLVELRACQCHWPTARDQESERWLFCGSVTEPERSYCAYHRQIGTVPKALRPVRESSQGSALLGIRMLDPDFVAPALSAEA